jgi:hypothetical protein
MSVQSNDVWSSSLTNYSWWSHDSQSQQSIRSTSISSTSPNNQPCPSDDCPVQIDVALRQPISTDIIKSPLYAVPSPLKEVQGTHVDSSLTEPQNTQDSFDAALDGLCKAIFAEHCVSTPHLPNLNASLTSPYYNSIMTESSQSSAEGDLDRLLLGGGGDYNCSYRCSGDDRDTQRCADFGKSGCFGSESTQASHECSSLASCCSPTLPSCSAFSLPSSDATIPESFCFCGCGDPILRPAVSGLPAIDQAGIDINMTMFKDGSRHSDGDLQRVFDELTRRPTDPIGKVCPSSLLLTG